MLLMTPTQALTTAQAIREARTLAAYIQMLNRSKRKPDEILVKQSERLSAALHAMDETKDDQPPAATQTPTLRRA